jgi:hypothetical protein
MKVALLRNELKKLGQACAVKLLPREVSNALGRGDGALVLDVAVSILSVELLVDVAFAVSVIVFVGVATTVLWIVMVESTSVEEAAAADASDSEVGVASGAAVEPKGSALSCLCRMVGLGGGSRRSIAISPLCANRLNREESYSSYGTSIPWASAVVKNVVTKTTIKRIEVVRSPRWCRFLPGRGLQGCEYMAADCLSSSACRVFECLQAQQKF